MKSASQFNNGLSVAEAERLALLAEECGELVQAIGKVLRHGYDSTHPADPHGPNNRANLEREMGDVRAAMILLCSAGDANKAEVRALAEMKLVKVRQYLHHQGEQRL